MEKVKIKVKQNRIRDRIITIQFCQTHTKTISILQRNYEETIARFALVKEIEKELKAEGTQEAFIEEMMTRKELYEIIGYEDYEGIDKKISKKI